jgi:RNA polymerase sigma-70 factor (ECF subfamily)
LIAAICSLIAAICSLIAAIWYVIAAIWYVIAAIIPLVMEGIASVQSTSQGRLRTFCVNPQSGSSAKWNANDERVAFWPPGGETLMHPETNSTSDDLSLAEAARLEPQAFAALYDRYIDRIYAYALRQSGDVSLAQDVTSATFEKALRSLRRNGWSGQSFLAWLYRIARNEAIAHHRQERRMADLPPDLPAAVDQEGGLLADQEQERLVRGLARLSARDREVLTLRFIEGLSSAEAAEALGCSLPNLYLQAHRALRRLRVIITELDE